jgi:serine/threonine protein kinase/WD40 repeat protein
MSEQPNREVVVLNAALELRPTERAAYVDQACAGDAALRKQVEALLQAHERAEGFLEAPPAGLDFQRTVRLPIPLTEKPGDKIGRYKLLQQIGEGGCGVVHMAEQEEPVRRRVALKVIKLGMDTKQVIARFEAERQALALMDHPNIAKVLDAGATETGRPYFVMELVRGVKITDFCDENQLSTQERLKLFIQVCQAIQHAHQKGVIHRDIKPSNILVTVNDGVPVPKVIDFGIAKATQGRLTDRTLFTAFEQFIGTPAYMSPEQAVMTSLDVDTRGDIYSLGVLLYELITGRTPFDQKELLAAGLDGMRRTIREKEPPKPSTRLRTLLAADLTTTANCRQTEPPRLLHSVRGDLDWIVMKALEKDRTRRYETANGLAMDVQRHLNNEPVNARPPSNLYRLQKMVQRNRLAFAGAAAGVVALVLALVILGISNLRIARERNQKDGALNAARTSEQRAKEELFVSLRSQAQARRYSRQIGQRLDSLAALAEAARIRPDPGLRDEAIAAMALPDVRRGPQWSVSQTNCAALGCDLTYRRYASLDFQGNVVVRDIADGQEALRIETGNRRTGFKVLAFSPDGRFLVKVEEGEKAQVWLLDNGESVLQDAPEVLKPPAFSSDSRLIALAEGDSIRCFDLATGLERNHWKTAGSIYSLDFNPRGRQIAIGYRDQPRVSIYEFATGRETTQLLLGPPSTRGTVRWHPEGKLLAVGSSDPRIQIWDVEAQRKLATLEGHVQDVDQLTFHPGGQLLASRSWDGVMRLWDLATARPTMQIPLSAQLQFSKDGRWLGSFWADEEHAQLLELTPTQEYFTLENRPGRDRPEYYFCAPSPDNRLLAGAMGDGIRLWDLPSRHEVAFLPSDQTASVMFESDGRALLTCSEGAGLLQWPIRQSGTNPSDLAIGPPQQIKTPFAPQRFALSDDIGTLAIVSETAGKAAVLRTAKESTQSLLVQHPSAAFVALSQGAKWLATSGWHSDRVRLWNTESGELAWERVVGKQTRVSFTPDGQQLIIGRGSEFSFLDVNTLEIKRRLRREVGLFPGDVVFSPDGKLMAMEMAPGVIHLKDVSTHRTVAQIEDPTRDRSNGMAFASDGTKLIVVSIYAAAIHLWDLRAMRSRLKTIGLDWDWPEFPPPKNTQESRLSAAGRGLKIQVVGADAQ